MTRNSIRHIKILKLYVIFLVPYQKLQESTEDKNQKNRGYSACAEVSPKIFLHF